jgi:cobalt-precorrin 5A hydrolase
VRSIAPFLKSKQLDPAVLCVDETAAFVIPLVSGHIGGANREAAKLADGLRAVPVITTATDLNGKFAVDIFAVRNGLRISDLSLAKRISAAVLEGKRIPVISEFPVDGNVPGELELKVLPGKSRDDESGRRDESGQRMPEAAAPGIRIGISAAERSEELRLVPGIVTIGLGCRRGKDEKEMLSFIEDVLARENIDPLSVVQIATIDVKKDEPAMKAAAAHFGTALKVFDAASLAACPGTFAHSDFVNKTVGVDNVCERSALLGALAQAGHAGAASGAGSGHPAHLIVRKTAADGMTMAAAVRDWRGHFE